MIDPETNRSAVARTVKGALPLAIAALLVGLTALLATRGLAQEEGMVVPTEGDALFAFLAEGGYEGFPAEPEAHPSAGPHGLVRTFVTPALADAITAGAETMPVGAAAIKELRGDDGSLNGWAVSVKVDGEAENGLGWYWYETFDTSGSSPPEVDEVGAALCVGCHAQASDFVVSTGPFEGP